MVNEKGFSLIEVIISIAILSIIGTGIMAALGTASKELLTTDERETAQNIAEMQMEYIKSQPYASSYLPEDISATYPGYSAIIETGSIVSRDGDIQKITMVVHHGIRTILTQEGYKVR